MLRSSCLVVFRKLRDSVDFSHTGLPIPLQGGGGGVILQISVMLNN